MRGNRLILGLSVSLVAMLSACGSYTHGSSQDVDVIVKGSPNAYCEFTTDKTRNAGHFPNKMTIERSHKPLHADCTGEQNLHTEFDIESKATASGTAGNVPLGIFVPAGYDAATGGLWAYPDPIIVDFRVVQTDPPNKGPNWPANNADTQIDATRIGTADIPPPAPVRMQPVMDEDLNPALSARTPIVVKKVEIVDAARLAVDQGAQPVAVTTTTTTTTTTTSAKMAPIASPEDKMGIDPGKVKAKEAAKKKAAAEAKRKAKEEAAAKERAEAEAKAAAEKAATLPETTTPPPATEPAPVAAEPAPGTATEDTATAPTPTPVPADEPAKTEGDTGTPDAPQSDVDNYLKGQ